MISKTDVKKLSELARIEVSEKEIGELQKDLERVLTYVEQLNRAETGSVELSRGGGLRQENNMRDDNPEKGRVISDANALIESAPASERGFVKVLPVWKR
jgi:aspartyl/glutamyl-tRNA(Asn/Gln) amidotransferase C subunit